MNNLNLPLVAPNQNQKELTINDQALALDAAIGDILSIDMSLGDVQLTIEEFTRNFLFSCAGNVDVRVLNVWPAKRFFAVQNNGNEVVTVRATPTGETVQVGASEMSILHSDGENVRTAVAGSAIKGIEDVEDDEYYVRMTGKWLKLVAGKNTSINEEEDSLILSSSGGDDGIQDAPDDSPHVRVSGEWLKLVAGANVTFDTSEPGKLTVKAASNGGEEQVGEFMAPNIVQTAGFMGRGRYLDIAYTLTEPPAAGNLLLVLAMDYSNAVTTKSGWTLVNLSQAESSIYAKIFYRRATEDDEISGVIEGPYSQTTVSGQSSILIELSGGVIAPLRGDIESYFTSETTSEPEFIERPLLPQTLLIGAALRLGSGVESDTPMSVRDNVADVIDMQYTDAYNTTSAPGKTIWFSRVLPNARERTSTTIDIPDSEANTRMFSVHVLPDYKTA